VTDILTEVLEAKVCVTKRRIGMATIKHGRLIVYCDICLYKDSHVWVRMPEFWSNGETKIHHTKWESKKVSDEEQVSILNKVFDMLDWNLEKCIQLRNDYFAKMRDDRKELTKQENKLTLHKKNTEE